MAAASRRSSSAARLAAAALACVTGAVQAQQVPDRDYAPAIHHPMYEVGKGPAVCVDQAHHNFHTLGERFAAFGNLVARDGYRPVESATPFTAAALAACDVLVISNAQPNDDEWNTYPRPTPSAFTAAEIAAVHDWVARGHA